MRAERRLLVGPSMKARRSLVAVLQAALAALALQLAVVGFRGGCAGGVPPALDEQAGAMRAVLVHYAPGAHFVEPTYRAFMAEAERALMVMTMQRCKGNQVHAAKFLGISRNTLRQRLAQYEL